MKLEVITRTPEDTVRPTQILFVHGMFHAAWSWDEYFLPYFAQHGYTAHALSLRGHGGSEGRARLRWTSVANYVADVVQVMADLPESTVLVGHSMGGMVVQKYLQTHQAAGAVLLGSVSPRGMLPVTLRTIRHHPLAFLKANLTLSTYPVIGTQELYRELFYAPDIPAGKLANYYAKVQDESYWAYLQLILVGLTPPPPITGTPLLVLGSSTDVAVTPAEVEVTARRHNTQAEFFPEMGHGLMLETRWQAIADRILAWLGEQGL